MRVTTAALCTARTHTLSRLCMCPLPQSPTSIAVSPLEAPSPETPTVYLRTVECSCIPAEGLCVYDACRYRHRSGSTQQQQERTAAGLLCCYLGEKNAAWVDESAPFRPCQFLRSWPHPCIERPPPPPIPLPLPRHPLPPPAGLPLVGLCLHTGRWKSRGSAGTARRW